ncbi:MAG: hypothetical protein RBS78_05465 [Coriobacteriia bacterium]|jgi:hypothetical protein|nr:hypothetical protein [Coriobacteriia bacterium]
MKFKKDTEGMLVLDESGDPIAISDKGEAEKLRKQTDELSAKSGSVEDLQKQITDLQDKPQDHPPAPQVAASSSSRVYMT